MPGLDGALRYLPNDLVFEVIRDECQITDKPASLIILNLIAGMPGSNLILLELDLASVSANRREYECGIRSHRFDCAIPHIESDSEQAVWVGSFVILCHLALFLPIYRDTEMQTEPTYSPNGGKSALGLPFWSRRWFSTTRTTSCSAKGRELWSFVD